MKSKKRIKELESRVNRLERLVFCVAANTTLSNIARKNYPDFDFLFNCRYDIAAFVRMAQLGYAVGYAINEKIKPMSEQEAVKCVAELYNIEPQDIDLLLSFGEIENKKLNEHMRKLMAEKTTDSVLAWINKRASHL